MNEIGSQKTTGTKETDMDRVIDRLYRLQEKMSMIDGSLGRTTTSLVGSEPIEAVDNKDACQPNGKIQELLELIGTLDNIASSLEGAADRLSMVA